MLKKQFKDIVKGDYVFVIVNNSFYIEQVRVTTSLSVVTNLLTYTFDKPIKNLSSFYSVNNCHHCTCNFKELLLLILKLKRKITKVYLLHKNGNYVGYSVEKILNFLKMDPEFFNNYSKENFI